MAPHRRRVHSVWTSNTVECRFRRQEACVTFEMGSFSYDCKRIDSWLSLCSPLLNRHTPPRYDDVHLDALGLPLNFKFERDLSRSNNGLSSSTSSFTSLTPRCPTQAHDALRQETQAVWHQPGWQCLTEAGPPYQSDDPCRPGLVRKITGDHCDRKTVSLSRWSS